MEMIQASRVKFADLRFYEDGLGIEFSDSLSKGILVDFNGDGSYVNPFDLAESYPVFKRAPVSNVTGDGHVYGTKMYHVSNDLVTGPCWVLCSEHFSKVYSKEVVSLAELEDFVLSSPDFYKDRTTIAQSRIKKRERPFRMGKIVENDGPSIWAMNNFFSERVCGIQKVKEY